MSGKTRSCCYVKDNIKFEIQPVKNNTLELISIVIDDILLNGFYRPFKIPHHNTHKEYLAELVDELRNQKDMKNKLLIGDFNLDMRRKIDQNYQYNGLFEILDEYLIESNLINIEGPPTWSRIIGNTIKESTLDICQ